MIVVYIVLGLILVLFLIALVNTFRIKLKDKDDVLPVINKDLTDKYAKEFGEMIKVKTLSYVKEKKNIKPFLEMQEVMKNLFPNVYKKMEQKVFEDGSLLFKLKGESNEKPMVLMAHQDIVPANEKAWSFKPFSGEVTDEEILGRGTIDTKSTLYSIFKAVDELIEEGITPKHDIYISSSSNEEISGSGAKSSVEYLKENGVTPYFVLDEGGAIVTGSLPSVKKAVALIGVIEKGYCNIKFTAKGTGGHSSTPPKDTPIARLSKFVSDIENNFPFKTKMIPEVAATFTKTAPSMSFGYRFLFGNMWLFKPLVTFLLPKTNPFGRALLSTTIAFTMASGSKQENVIPSEAYVIANLRIHPIQGIDSSFAVLEKIAKKYNLEATLLEGREASPISSTKNEAYQFLINTIALNYPDILVSPYVMLAATDCRFFSEVTDSAYRFSPIRMDNDDIKKIHGINESIKKTSLVEAVSFYKSLIEKHQ